MHTTNSDKQLTKNIFVILFGKFCVLMYCNNMVSIRIVAIMQHSLQGVQNFNLSDHLSSLRLQNYSIKVYAEYYKFHRSF